MSTKKSDLSYFVKFKFYQTTSNQEPYKIQKYEVETQRFEDLFQLLPINDGPYTIRYLDPDGDLCTIDSNATLKVALRNVPSSSTLVLRIDHKASGSSHNRKRDKINYDNQKNKRSLRSGGVKKETKDIKQELKAQYPEVRLNKVSNPKNETCAG